MITFFGEYLGKKKIFPTVFLTTLLFGCTSGRPANPGMTGGRLAPCPSSPNCVSSQSLDLRHFIEPLRYEGTRQQARDRLLAAIRTIKRSRVVEAGDLYIHAEFTSAFFRFVDDAEFYLDDTSKIIHMRSASRIGYGDFGVNRKRLEALKAAFLLGNSHAEQDMSQGEASR